MRPQNLIGKKISCLYLVDCKQRTGSERLSQMTEIEGHFVLAKKPQGHN